MNRAVVSFEDVNKTFGERTNTPTIALQDIDLSITSGEFVSIIGPSGCGKSTLLRLVGDLLEPTSGQIQINGKSAYRARQDQDYGMVFQTPVLFEWRRVAKNVQLPMELRGMDKQEQKKRTDELLALVELTGFERHYPWQLSGGMQQRVAIARALAIQPQILLMDEPFGALDEMTRERMNQELHHIWQQTKTTVIFITHSIAEAVFLSTKILVMSARPGKILHTVDVDLPIPRGEHTRKDSRFFAIETEVRDWLRQAEGASH